MKEILTIDNIGPIKHAEIDLKSAMIFIGPQASGKSTIAKIIAVVKDWDIIYREEEFNDIFEKYNLQSYITSESKINFECDAYSIKFSNIKGRVVLNQEHNLFKLIAEIDKSASRLKKIDADYIIKFRKELERKKELGEKTDDKDEKTLYDISYEFLNFYKNSAYIPAERIFVPMASGSFLNLANNKVPIPKNILEFGAEYEKARAEIKELKTDILNVSFKFENEEDRIYINDNKFIKLKESSTGIQNLIPMLLVIENQNAFVTQIIEEPELDLFPETQQRLSYYLASKCLDANKLLQKNLIITTHSPYVLSSFNNLVFAYQVAQKGLKMEISKIIPQKSWINPENFNAYYVAEGTARTIFDKKTNLISENELDKSSEYIMSDFYKLMEIYKSIPSDAR